MNEGYIKFQVNQIADTEPSLDEVQDLLALRIKLYDLGLIGFAENISYGNVSKRISHNTFIITATNTGKTREIETKDLVKVISVDIEKNLVHYVGKLPPSSETLTHFAIYSTFEFALFVVHFHHKRIWQKWLFQLPTTPVVCEYGSVQLAQSIAQLSPFFQNDEDFGVVILGGHRDGVMVFGRSIDAILKCIKQLQ
ncbi:MAG: class II aldolase/adducin family protein [Candidatus Kapaibacteriota bacterium]